jgi:hypothetical protein
MGKNWQKQEFSKPFTIQTLLILHHPSSPCWVLILDHPAEPGRLKKFQLGYQGQLGEAYTSEIYFIVYHYEILSKILTILFIIWRCKGVIITLKFSHISPKTLVTFPLKTLVTFPTKTLVTFPQRL